LELAGVKVVNIQIKLPAAADNNKKEENLNIEVK